MKITLSSFLSGQMRDQEESGANHSLTSSVILNHVFWIVGHYVDRDIHKFHDITLPEFSGWKRASQLFKSPEIIVDMNWRNVKQQKVKDCSVIAALIVCAHYEEMFPRRKPLISQSIYPQNGKGTPVYNSQGKYGIKLYFNGAERLVFIDDFLPLDAQGQPLCSRTVHNGELWVSLFEKAYLKLGCNQGYHLTGSKGDYDLCAFTGWIPDRMRLQLTDEESSPLLDKEEIFYTLQEGIKQGHALVIAATCSNLSKRETHSVGLHPRHSYAVMEIGRAGGLKFIKLKNPWARLSWTGKYSATDTESWTEILKSNLNFDPEKARMRDDGIFWMEYSDFCKYFEIFYINWNPQMFARSLTVSISMDPSAGQELKLDGEISKLPQFLLQVSSSADELTIEVWILAMRHVDDVKSFALSKEYICLSLYENNGRRVHFSQDSSIIFDGFHRRYDPSRYFLAKCKNLKTDVKYTVVILHRSVRNAQCFLSCYSEGTVSLKQLSP